MHGRRCRVSFAAFLVVTIAALSGPAVAAPPPPTAAAGADPAAAAKSPNPELAPRYRDFLEEVAMLMSPKERAAFLALNRDYQRDAFIKRFWEIRDPFPQTPRNELKEAWDERVALARKRFGSLAADDRARMLLANGEPQRQARATCSEVLLPLEIWSYDRSGRLHNSFSLVFYQPQGAVSGAYKLWHPSEGIQALVAFDLRARSPQGMALSALADACPSGMELAGAISEALDWEQMDAKYHLLPRPGDEWLTAFASFSTDVPAGAAALPAKVEIAFPGRLGSRTVTQAVIQVPKAACQVERLQDAGFCVFTLDGEVLLHDELFEHFRYRFNLAQAQAQGDSLPLVFERYLRPGTYSLVLKLEDLAGKRYFREQRELEVPLVSNQISAQIAERSPGGAPPAAAPAPAGPQAASASGPAAAAAPRSDAASAAGVTPHDPNEQTIRLLPPPEGLLTGALRIEAVAAGAEVARVAFMLDGKPVLSKAHPPYSVELNLGPQPRTHQVKAVALGRGGEALAEDRLLLNAGPHHFGVRLTEPQPGRFYRTSLRAQAEVEVPEGEVLDRVEFFVNENSVATLFQRPFTQPIVISDPGRLSYVRAVAYLADGNSTEDLVLVNSPNPGERVDVEFVELFTTVADHRGRPVEGLTRDDFNVLEDGVPQAIRRFELVRDLPIYAGVLIDTSGSMETKLDSAVQGALGFFREVVKPKDRAAVFTFSSQVNLAVRFTSNPDVLAGGLAGLHAEGNTVLYDAIIEALYYFGGIRGKRALVLLTDGRDEGSRHPYADALEYARRSGISLYCVGIGLSSQDADVRFKLQQLASETGGRSFFVDHSSGLKGVWSTIEQELRSQYLVAYQSSKPGNDGKFRTVEVKLARRELAAKTIHGYYP